jgi:hypothetical protein
MLELTRPNHCPARRSSQSQSQSSSTASRRGQRGASYAESLLALLLVALLVFGALQALGGKVAEVARGQGEAIASFRARRVLPPTPPAARSEAAHPRSAPPPEKKGPSLWGTLADIAIDMSPIGDIETLLDPNASIFDKVLAGVSLATTFVPGVGQAVRGASIAVKVAKAADKTAGVVDHAKDVNKAVHETEEGADIVAAGKRGKKAEDEGGSAEEPVWVQHPEDGPIREYPASEVGPDPSRGATVETPEGPGQVVSRGEPPDATDVRQPAHEPAPRDPPPVPRTPTERARDVAAEVRTEVMRDRDLTKTGRSGGAIGAQADVKVGAELIRRANQTRDKELAAELKKLGKRLIERGQSGVHK